MESCWHSCNYRKVSFNSSHWFCISLPFRIQKYFLFYSEACNWTRNSESDSEYLRLNIRYSCSCLENEEVVSNSSKWLHIDKSDVTDCEWNWKLLRLLRISFSVQQSALCCHYIFTHIFDNYFNSNIFSPRSDVSWKGQLSDGCMFVSSDGSQSADHPRLWALENLWPHYFR